MLCQLRCDEIQVTAAIRALFKGWRDAFYELVEQRHRESGVAMAGAVYHAFPTPRRP
jgi:hypothetical protein